jgi:hypothetical protein
MIFKLIDKILYFLTNITLVYLLLVVIWFLNIYQVISTTLFITLFIIIPSISLILFIIKKEWKLFFNLIFTLPIFIIAVIIFTIITDFYKPNITIADANFYKSEIYDNTKIKLTNSDSIIYKLDTIRYSGNEGEYDAFCFIKTTKKSSAIYKKQLSSNRDFNKNTTLPFGKSVFDISEIKANEFGEKYSCEIEGSRCTVIQFSKNGEYIYFSTSTY